METVIQGHYEVFVRGLNFRVQSIVPRFERLEFKKVYNDCGYWELELDSASPAARLMFNLFSRDNTGGLSGIVVTLEGNIVFSGFTDGFEITGDYESQNDQQNIMFWGYDDNALLARRLLMVPRVFSDPSIFEAPYNQNWGIWEYPSSREAKYRRSVSNVIYTMVADNIGFQTGTGTTDAPYSREIKYLDVRGPDAIGPHATVRGRYQNLLEKCKEIAYYLGDDAFQKAHPNYQGVQFKTIQLLYPIYVYTSVPTNKKLNRVNKIVPPDLLPPISPSLPLNTQEKRVQFTIFQPRDKRNSVVFSKGIKTLGAFRYRFQSPQSTYLVCGGQNNKSSIEVRKDKEGVITSSILPDSDPRTRWFAHARCWVNGLYLDSRFGLKETFLDRRDIQVGQEWTDTQKANPEPYPIVVKDWSKLTPAQYKALPLAQKQYVKMEEQIVQALETEKVEKQATLEIEITPINIPPCRVFRDYDIGDFVTVIIPGLPEDIEVVAQIRELTVTLTKEEGQNINLVIGTVQQPRGRDIFSRISNMTKKTNNLEELR